MPGPTGSQFRPLSRLRRRPARAVPQYTRAGRLGSTATHWVDRPPRCSSTVQVEARRAINRAARVTTTMPTMTQSPPYSARPLEALSCRVCFDLALPAHWATSHEPLVVSRRCPSRLGLHLGVRTRSQRLVVLSPLPAVARFG